MGTGSICIIIMLAHKSAKFGLCLKLAYVHQWYTALVLRLHLEHQLPVESIIIRTSTTSRVTHSNSHSHILSIAWWSQITNERGRVATHLDHHILYAAVVTPSHYILIKTLAYICLRCVLHLLCSRWHKPKVPEKRIEAVLHRNASNSLPHSQLKLTSLSDLYCSESHDLLPRISLSMFLGHSQIEDPSTLFHPPLLPCPLFVTCLCSHVSSLFSHTTSLPAEKQKKIQSRIQFTLDFSCRKSLNANICTCTYLADLIRSKFILICNVRRSKWLLNTVSKIHRKPSPFKST